MKTIAAAAALLLTLIAAPAFAAQPSTPSNVKAMAQGTFGLIWDYSDPVDGFIVQYAPAGQGAPYQSLQTVPGFAMLNGQVAVLDLPAPAPGTWDLVVVAFKGAEISEPSNVVRMVVAAPIVNTPPPPPPCTYILPGGVSPDSRPVGYLLIGRIVYSNTDANSKTAAALRVEQLHKWGWIGSPWPEIDPVDGASVLRVRFWCRVAPVTQ